MKVEQIYTGCLAQGAYYIESDKEAVIIDPLREIQPYLAKAQNEKAKIKYVLETHFHADFVSGHLDLAEATGATIVYGPNATPKFKAHIAKDGEVLEVGKAKIKVLHTPGHTMESVTYLLYDEQGKEYAIFTGDTLFIGDVGRPDLAAKSDLTKEELAGLLYDSLRNKIMPLPDHIYVYPAHGAGSACGKSMSKETFDTLGNQKKYNYALDARMTKQQFVEAVLEGLTPPPQYFPANVKMNKEGYDSIGEVLQRGTKALNPEEFETVANETRALILDARKPEEFAKAHIPNSINIGIDGNFAPWVGALITDIKQPILIVADKGREEEVVTRLARVGYDHSLGYIEGGIDTWIKAGKEVDTIENISAEKFAELLSKNKIHVLDVRREYEYQGGHVKEAENIPLDYINENMNKIDKGQQYFIHCAGGYRSMIAASILKARGVGQVVNIAGGYKAIAATNAPITDESEVNK
ncbi:MAG TPA: MBL fold metallo-hydrolase [Cytophagaceae bacterium]